MSLAQGPKLGVEDFQRTTVFETPCQGCVFAEMFNSIQVGCKLGRLEKFRKLGRVVEGPYHKVIGICNYRRDDRWSGNPDQVKEEARLQLEYLIIEDTTDSREQVIDKLKTTVANLTEPTTLVLHNKNVEISNLGEISTLVDRIEKIFFPTDLIDQGLKKIGAQYYTIVVNGETVEKDHYDKLEKTYNEDLTPFLMVKSDRITGTTIQTRVHKTLRHVYSDAMPELIEGLAEQQNSKMVIKLENI